MVCSEILLPPHAPPAYADRQTLWNAVEQVEKNGKAQLAYSFDIALQNELSLDENITLARQFLLEQFVSRGMIVDYAVHQPDKESGGISNPHFHVLCPIRPLKANGEWDAKQHREYVLDEQGNRVRDEAGNYVFNAVPTTDWGKPETLEEWRRAWADLCNAKFAEKGLKCRIDHRSYERRGVGQLPTVHGGPAVRQMEARGIHTGKGEFNRWVKAANAMMKKARQKITALLEWLKEARAELSKSQEPTLADILSRYYADRNAGAWSQKARLVNLKSFSAAVNYLTENKLFTLADLETRLEDYQSRDKKMKASLDSKTARIKKIDRLMQLAGFYAEGKPLHDKLNSIKFKKSRKKYKAEQEHTLHFFYLARRELKPYLDEGGKLPVVQWEAERTRLKQEYAAESEAYKPILADLKSLRQIQYAVDSAHHEQERVEQRQSRKYEQER